MEQTPQRVQLSRAKGWRMPENTVKVSRPGPWGNPFIVSIDGTNAECVRRFELLLTGLVDMRNSTVARRQSEFLSHFDNGRALAQLRGKNLACWCRMDRPCHADVLLRLANPGATT